MMRKNVKLGSRMQALAIGAVFVFGVAANAKAAITVTSSSATVAPGEDATIVYSISGTSDNVATYNAEVSYDSANLEFVSCDVDARLANQIGQFTEPSPGTVILFVGDTSPPVDSFGDGTMATCTFRAGQTEGQFPLETTFLEVGDALASVLDASAVDGQVNVVIPPPTNTPTETPIPTNTPIPTDTPIPTITSTPGAENDSGCQINASGGGSAWLLLLPAMALFLVRRRER